MYRELQRRFGPFTPVRLHGGYTNEMFLLDGTTPPLAAKIARQPAPDAENEAHCLRLLQTDRVPALHGVVQTDEDHITIVSYREGKNGQALMDEGDETRTMRLYDALGRTLARHIHSQLPAAEAGIRSAKPPALDVSFIPAPLTEQSRQLLKLPAGPFVLTHGDYGPHNVLYTQTNDIVILDWEWAEWGHPRCDLAWTCWFTKLHYPQHADRWNAQFIAAYTSIRPIEATAAQLQSCALYKVWQLLQRLEGAAPAVQQEWLRRLQWTLQTPIFPFLP